MQNFDRQFFENAMQDKQISLRGLARQMEIGHSALSLTFAGSRKLQIEEAAKLSNILGIPIHRIIEACGVPVRPITGRRASVIGAVRGDGTVGLNPDDLIERTVVPDDLPDDTQALQFRTIDSALAWTDGWIVFFREPRGVDPASLSRWSYCKIKDGPAVVATIRRGYRDNTYNLSGTFGRENAALDWATPILVTKN